LHISKGYLPYGERMYGIENEKEIKHELKIKKKLLRCIVVEN